MIPLTQHDIDELRLAADKAKRDGHFEAGQRLEALLDAFEEAEEHEHRADEQESRAGDAEEDAESLREALRDIQKACEEAKGGKWSYSPTMSDEDVRLKLDELRGVVDSILTAACEALR